MNYCNRFPLTTLQKKNTNPDSTNFVGPTVGKWAGKGWVLVGYSLGQPICPAFMLGKCRPNAGKRTQPFANHKGLAKGCVGCQRGPTLGLHFPNMNAGHTGWPNE